MASTYLDRVGNKALGQMLVDKGALRDEQVTQALDFARDRGLRLGEALVELGYIGTDALSYAIAEQYGQRPMELHPSMVDERLLRSFDGAILWRHLMLPLIELENELVVVVADPNDRAGLDALAEARPGMRIVPQLAAEAQICRCLETVFPEVAECHSEEEPEKATGLRQLSDFEEMPRPGSAGFVDWIMSVAAVHAGNELVLRRRDSALQALVTGGSGEEIGRWEAVNFMAMLRTLLARATGIAFTQNQAWRIAASTQNDSEIFDFLVLTPIAEGEPFVRVRALRRGVATSHSEDADTAIYLERIASMVTAAPGQFVVVEVPPGRLGEESISAQRLAAEFACKIDAERQVVLVTGGALAAAGDLAAYPAGVTDVVAAAQAHGARCVVFDYLPGGAEILRLMAALDPGVAVVVFFQVLPGWAEQVGGVSDQRRDAAATLSDQRRDVAGTLPGARWVVLSDLSDNGGAA